MYFLWQRPSLSLFAKFCLEFLFLFCFSALQSPSSLRNHSVSLLTVASHNVRVFKKNPQALSSSSAQPFGFLKTMESGLQIGTCTDCLHTWTWIFWSLCITQSTDMIDTWSWFFSQVMYRSYIWLCWVIVVAYHVSCGTVWSVLFVCFCAMFSQCFALYL